MYYVFQLNSLCMQTVYVYIDVFVICWLYFSSCSYAIIKKISGRNFEQWKQWVAWVTLSDGLAELWALIPWQWQEACSGGRRPHRKGSAHVSSERRYNGHLFLFFFLFEGIKGKQRVWASSGNNANQDKEAQHYYYYYHCFVSSLILITLSVSLILVSFLQIT